MDLDKLFTLRYFEEQILHKEQFILSLEDIMRGAQLLLNLCLWDNQKQKHLLYENKS